MEHIIEVTNLVKYFGAIKAVDNVSFFVKKGQLFSFLGPNGAGKSTTIKALCTFLNPDEGTVVINGFTLGIEDDKIRASIGVVFQESLLDNLLSVENNLKIRGSFYGMSKSALHQAIATSAKTTGIEEIMGRRYGNLSGGQRRRVDIARALINTPKILFLDEPTTGLDPQTRNRVWATIKRLQQEHDLTVFLTTHYMEEAQRADYCVIIDDGKIAVAGTPGELKNRYVTDKLILKCSNQAAVTSYLEEHQIDYSASHDDVTVALRHTLDAIAIVGALENFIGDFYVVQGSMDDVFLNVTGKELRE